MRKKYWCVINKVNTYLCLCISLLMPYQLFAIPSSIASIVRTFQGQNKQKRIKPKVEKAKVFSKDAPTDNSQSIEAPPLGNVQQARLAIDKAIQDHKLTKHPATWYYRGVIYDRLLRDHIGSEEASFFLNEALTAYGQAKELGLLKSKQFHSFALANLASLWRYFFNRGMAYHRQEMLHQAVDQFAICRRILPQEPSPLLYTAIVYHSYNEPEKALQYYQDYLELKGPESAVLRAMAAIHYHNFKNFDTAVAILNKGLLEFPFNNELLEETCLIYEASGKIDEYATSLALGMQDINACYAYAYLLEYQGRIHEAITYYQQILKEHPHQYDTLRQVGFLFYNEAIKLYTHTLKLVDQKEPIETPKLAIWSGLIDVMVPYFSPHTIHSMAWLMKDYPFSNSKQLFSVNPRWVIYDPTLFKHNLVSMLGHLMQAGQVPYTSPLYPYMHKKYAIALAGNRWIKSITELEKYLKKSLFYLKIARAQDKQDKTVAQALYYSYYHLKKYCSAYRLLQKMQKQKQYLNDDPFMGHKGNQ